MIHSNHQSRFCFDTRYHHGGAMNIQRKELLQRSFPYLYVLLCIVVIAYFDLSGRVDYATKSLLKIGLFGVLPYMLLNRPKFKTMLGVNRSTRRILFVGIVMILVIVAGYFATKLFISYDLVVASLENRLNVTLDNFLFVSLYIVLINSGLEEFFFRHFIPLQLDLSSQWTNRLVSSLLFAIYHVAILYGMFELCVVLLMIVGLWIVGVFFSLLNQNNKGFLNSYLFHACANIGINLVGLLLFLG
ncbi:MAG TPA: CPBP family intramembrane metalloprotease [Erysipelotrichaceae bacterium]|nr:CPBP family intramembrane metalloprotease [Erysipelotrichaceae bacterium]HBZ40575.1 CPBP family intramembrane metalloprotease [Erysipelotrichaceae bacterium]